MSTSLSDLNSLWHLKLVLPANPRKAFWLWDKTDKHVKENCLLLIWYWIKRRCTSMICAGKEAGRMCMLFSVFITWKQASFTATRHTFVIQANDFTTVSHLYAFISCFPTAEYPMLCLFSRQMCRSCCQTLLHSNWNDATLRWALSCCSIRCSQLQQR